MKYNVGDIFVFEKDDGRAVLTIIEKEGKETEKYSYMHHYINKRTGTYNIRVYSYIYDSDFERLESLNFKHYSVNV